LCGLLSLLEAGMRHPKERGSENANGEGFWDKWEGFLLFLDFLPLFPENLLHWRAARFRFDFPSFFWG